MRRFALSMSAAILLISILTVSWGIGGEREEDLLEAAGDGDVAKVEDLLRKGTDVNARDREGQTALVRAASAGHEKTVAKLLTAGAHVHLIPVRDSV